METAQQIAKFMKIEMCLALRGERGTVLCVCVSIIFVKTCGQTDLVVHAQHMYSADHSIPLVLSSSDISTVHCCNN